MKKIIICFLNFFNFQNIGNENGNTHIKLNILDFLFAIGYFIISFYGLWNVSKTLLFANICVLADLLINNVKVVINYKDAYNKLYLKQPKCGDYPINLFIAVLEVLVIIFVFIPFLVQGSAFDKKVVRAFGFFVILMNLIENVLKNIISAFEASTLMNGGVNNG